MNDGPLPIYIGFGSIVVEDPERMTELVLEAVRLTGVRAVISRGWSKLGSVDFDNGDVFYIDDCPHEWLFQRVAAVVHHGGAGTTACGLLYECPTTIIPFFGEYVLHSERYLERVTDLQQPAFLGRYGSRSARRAKAYSLQTADCRWSRCSNTVLPV